MSKLSFTDLATKTGLSEPALRALHAALVRGRGSLAQFDHPELGGMGQWMRGGMVMIGDLFNSALAARVSLACALLSENESTTSIAIATIVPEPRWWPADLGDASMTAAQNDLEYAYFPQIRRLAVRRSDVVSVYDTGDHSVRGIGVQSGRIVEQTEAAPIPLDCLRRV